VNVKQEKEVTVSPFLIESEMSLLIIRIHNLFIFLLFLGVYISLMDVFASGKE
jgi:hypothetical protein